MTCQLIREKDFGGWGQPEFPCTIAEEHAEERAVEYAEGSRTPLFEICHQILSKLLVNGEAISFYLGMEVIESGNARHRVWAVLLLSNPVAIPIFHKDHDSPSNNRHVDSKKCNLVSKTAIKVSCT